MYVHEPQDLLRIFRGWFGAGIAMLVFVLCGPALALGSPVSKFAARSYSESCRRVDFRFQVEKGCRWTTGLRLESVYGAVDRSPHPHPDFAQKTCLPGVACPDPLRLRSMVNLHLR